MFDETAVKEKVTFIEMAPHQAEVIYKKEDFPAGDIKQHLGLEKTDEDFEMGIKDNPIPEGLYFLEEEGGLGADLMIGSDTRDSLIPIEVVTASEENKLIGAPDVITSEKFTDGQRVTLVGQYKIPVSFESIRYLLGEKDKTYDDPELVRVSLDETTPPPK